MTIPEQPSFFIPPTFAWAERVTGRDGWQPSWGLIAFGMYVKRARRLIRMSQTKLEALSGEERDRLYEDDDDATPDFEPGLNAANTWSARLVGLNLVGSVHT